jgi:hypothetical protein
MTDPELLQALDYILNRSDEVSIEVLAEAVIRRRRNISIYSAMGETPDPHRMAQELTEKINAGIGGGLEGMRQAVREMIIRIVREHAPELTDSQVDELCRAWLPGAEAGGTNEQAMPRDMLLSMIDQFISFSLGTMSKSVDNGLRDELGAWPERYWKAFPPLIRQIITSYLKGKITERDFYSQIDIATGKN